jgi:hypothetical protein
VIPVLSLMSVVISFSMDLHLRTSKRASISDLTLYVDPLLCTQNASYKAPMALKNVAHSVTYYREKRENLR